MLMTALLLALAQSALTQQVSCPPWLSKDAFKPGRAPDGWVALMPSAARLSGGGLLYGPPEEQAYLRPDKTSERTIQNQTEYTTSWRLSQPHQFETWMFCSYGGQASLQIFKKVRSDANQCTATSRLTRGTFTEVQFECR
ncbi:STY0301 family protein [Massilia endophytica]|uniref:STY0301 family protein n=1 Tax=Massilia endophytica TaxID=2899220 RepID=UPI001E470E4C|nr:STY0301 family protein [Massilia endophytica]UGQ46353.1 hypothetical protein LSQ66_21735 [Massilia endophytica]